MHTPKSPLAAGSFGVALLCFFFPWASVSCPGGGGKLFQVKGVELVTGFSVEEPNMFGKPRQHQFPPQPLAQGALGCAGVGFAAALVWARSRNVKAVAAGVGVVGAVLLLLLKGQVEHDLVSKFGQELVALQLLQWEPGYWGTLAGLGAGFLISVFTWRFSGQKGG